MEHILYQFGLNNESVIGLDSNKDIEIDFFKSTIQMTTNGYPRYNIVNVENCTNVEVRNGDLIGDRLTHDYISTDSSHCWGMGVRSDNNNICNIFNMEISNMTGDAICNQNNTSGTTNINYCNIHHCRRMGITISDSDIVNVSNTIIQYIGTFDNIEGVNPMSGIDIEPTSEESTINFVSMNNINIKDTTSYGIISATDELNKVKEIDITNSEIDFAYINSNANISDSKLVYTTTRTGQLKNCFIKDSIIYKKNGSDFVLDNTIVDNCVFEGSDIEDAENDTSYRITFKNATVTNSIFRNIRGTENYETNSVADFGINLTSPNKLNENSKNNIYDNCTIIIDEFGDRNSEIKNSYIFVRNVDLSLNSIIFNNCMTNALSKKSVIRFNNCTVNNCGTFGNSEKHLQNTYMKCESLSSQSYFNINSAFDNSTIEIVGEINKNSFSNINFKNNSKIILDRYLNVNLNIPNSIEGTDYTIEYNGTEIIE